ncbi:MAG TPA: 1-acyl-sn-glycerol-3-phosphate acyltransferase [Ignavibacteriales bacterium]|nr:1-acyl-sn-glycerol-3-phosphate acyltransferase [Ignavibacteriales bacterium]
MVNTELPKTRLGKIRRFALSDLVTKEKTENYKDVDIPEDIEYKILSDYLKSVVKKDILPDQHFEFDLGLDSLAKVELVSKIEASFGIKLNENALSEHSTLRKLSAFVKEKKQKLEDDFINWNKLLKEKRIQKLPDNTFLLKVLKYISIPLFKTYFQLEIVGKENLPKTNCIIAPNHQSFIDGLLIACALNDNLLSKSYFFAKDKYIKYWFVKLFARFSNIVSLNLNADLKESIQKMAYILQNNKNIIIFPEGTRTRTGQMNDFKKSFAILSKELNVPIVPVTINGAYEALSIGSKIPKPKKIKLYFLTPVYPENKSYDEIVEEVRFKIYKQLNK